MTRIPIGVREFAVPLRREGSLASGSNAGLLPMDFGQEIHTRIQDRLKNEGLPYQAEYALQHSFKEGSIQMHVRGRCDGFYEQDEPILEEIKSTLRWGNLQKELDRQTEHPYILQLKVYGYLYWLRTGRKAL